MIEKFERIQRRSVKWILGEQDHHYNDVEYLSRLRDLDLMPMEFKFRYTDLIMFHQIYNDRSVVKLPYYLTNVTTNDRNRLRSTIRQPSRFSEFESSGVPDLNQRRNNRFDHLSLRSSVEARSRVPTF